MYSIVDQNFWNLFSEKKYKPWLADLIKSKVSEIKNNPRGTGGSHHGRWSYTLIDGRYILIANIDDVNKVVTLLDLVNLS